MITQITKIFLYRCCAHAHEQWPASHALLVGRSMVHGVHWLEKEWPSTHTSWFTSPLVWFSFCGHSIHVFWVATVSAISCSIKPIVRSYCAHSIRLVWTVCVTYRNFARSPSSWPSYRILPLPHHLLAQLRPPVTLLSHHHPLITTPCLALLCAWSRQKQKCLSDWSYPRSWGSWWAIKRGLWSSCSRQVSNELKAALT